MSEQGTALVDIRKQLEADAQGMVNRLQVGGDFIRVTQDKHFSDGGREFDGPLTAVILDFVAYNAWYDRKFNEDDVVPPACFALGKEPTKLVPHETAPVKQAKTCASCEKNEFPPEGGPKPCGNRRLLALSAPGDAPDAPFKLLRVSPTGIRAFDAYVKTIFERHSTGPIVVVTDIFFDPKSKYPSLRFGNPRPNENLEADYAKLASAKKRLMTPPDVSQYVPLVQKVKAAKK